MIFPLLMGTIMASSDKTKFIKAQIGNKTYKLEVAETIEQKSQGLSGRKRLAQNKGMLFVFPKIKHHAFWMKEMYFPLDFIWLQDNTVVDLTENVMLKNDPFSGRRKHTKVIELNAGQIKESQIKIGDTVYFHK